MNKGSYRLVWSQIRHMLVAVEETAVAHRGGVTIAPERRTSGLRRVTLFALRHVAFAALTLFGLTPVVSEAQIVPSGAHGPNVISTANGLPQVNVQKPSGAGVSLNTYSQFDVQKNGAILNNSSVIANTQLAGQINGNPNFAPNDAAKIIVNQVNSNNPSQLRGYVEVAGQKTAAVVIANPSGLVVDGGGFINTTRGVLTTGNPLIDANGNLTGFNVAAGSIAVQGAGLNASNIDQVDLVARAVQANAALYANTLNVVAGPNNVDYASLNATPAAGTGTVPGVSIDVGQLGGMWANRIVLVGNERGVGVNNAGVISAQAGDLTLTSAGQLVQTGQMTASGNVAIDAAGIANAGTIYAQRAATLATSGVLANSGTLAAQTDLTAMAGSVASTGVLGAGIDGDGSSGSSGNLTVTAAGLLSATGYNVAPGNVTLHGVSLELFGARNWAGAALDLAASGGYLSLANATTGAGSAITARAAGTLDNSGGTLNAPQLVLQAGSLANRSGSIAQTGTGLTTIAVSDTLDNTGGTLATNSADLALTPGTLVNDRGTITAAGTGTLSVSTGALSNNGGTIATNGSETIEAVSIANAGGVLSAAGSERVTATGGGIDNSAGGYIGGGSLSVNSTPGGVTNTAGTLEALNGPASVTAQAIANDGGIIHALGTAALAVSASQGLNNRGGLIGGNGTVTVSARTLDNSGGTLVAAGDLSATSSSAFANDGGAVAAAGDVDVNAGGGLSNAGGQIAAAGTNGRVRVSGASIDNTNGAITNAGTGALAITAAQTVTNAGTSALIAGNGNVTVAAATLLNTQGAAVSAAGTLGVNVSQRLANDGGKLASGGALSLDAANASATNTGGSISGGMVTLATAALDNSRGEISNYAGSSGNVAIQTGALGNAGGTIGSSADLSVSAAALLGDGQIVAGRDANVSLQGDFTYGAGNHITANRNLTFTTSGTLTNEGTLGAAGNATVSAANVINVAGATIGSGDPGDLTGGATTVDASGTVTNAGTIEGNTVTTRSATLTNTGTVIGRDVTVNAGMIVNDGAAAIIAGAQEVSLWAGNTLTNRNNATLYSLGNLNIAADGTRDAQGNLVNATGTVNNQSSTIQAGGDLSIAANQINNVRENIRTTTSSETQTYLMKELPWFQPPGGSGPFTDANAVILRAYYVDPADIVSITPVVTPDGYIVQKVVVNLPADASVFEWKQSGLSYALPNGGTQVQYGEQLRLTPEAGQVTLYVHVIEGGQTNPDQAGGTAWPQFENNVTQNLLGTVTYSSQYGDCTTSCVRLVTYPDYNDPNTQTLKYTERRRGGSGSGSLPVEVQREATQTITQTTLSSDSGAPAILTSGGAMNIRVGAQLNNENGTIAAGGDLSVNGAAGASSAAIRNTATELDTTYSFVNRSGYGSPWNADPNQPVEWVQWTNPSITMATGTAGGTITSNQAVTITGGEIANAGVRASSVPTGAAAPAGLAAPTLADAGSGTVRNVGGARAENLAVTLPTNGLYSINTAPDAAYLVVTDPRFTSYTKFISSDYMLGQLGLDPQAVAKRLGDGLYEQQQVQNQITQLTGRVYLQGYDNNLAEYQALMTAGVTFAQQFGLEPGASLTDAQMAALTTDIVWLVNQSVTLPDGSTQTVLVPQVYLAASGHANLRPTGALIAGDTVAIQGNNVTNRNAAIAANGNVLVVANNTIQNLGGLIAGANVGLAAGNDIVNASVTGSESSRFATGTSSHVSVAQVGQIVSSGSMVLQAGHDLTVTGAQVNAGGNLGISAGHAVNVGTVRTGENITTAAASGNTTASANTRENGSSIAAGGDLGVVSGGDIGVTGSDLKSGGNTVIAAAGDVSIRNATDSESTHLHGTNDDGWQDYRLSRESNRASTVSAGGDVTVLAGAQQDASGNLLLSAGGTQKHLNIEGSAVTADGAVTLGATGDVNVVASQQQSSMSDTWRQSSSNLVSHTATDSQSTFVASNATGSLVSGDTVNVVAGHDLSVQGSALVGTNAAALAAGHDVNITAAQNTVAESTYYHNSRSGLTGSGGLGFTIGSQEQTARTNDQSVTQSQARSIVGATQGNVSVTAGTDVHIGGSDIVAGKAANDATGNIVIAGQSVTIDPGLDLAQQQAQRETRSSGLTVGITGTPLDTARNVKQSASSGNAYQRTTNVLTSIGSSVLDTPSLSVSYGRSSSNSASDASSSVYTGSTVQGAGNVTLVATGGAQRDAAGKAIDGDLRVTGSSVTAGGTATLDANRNVILQASTDQYTQASSSSSSSSGFSLATPSAGDMVRWISGTPNNDGVSPSPYNASSASANGNGTVTQQTPAVVTGNNVVVTAHTGDIDVIGSGIAGTHGVSLAATQGNINVLAGMETATSHRESSTRQVGNLGGNGTGIGFSVGVASSHTAQDNAAQTQSTVRSQIVSTQGDVSLNAKQNVTVGGSDLSAANDLTVKGANVHFDPGTDSTRNSMSQSSSQWGVTVALGGVVGDTIAAVNSGMNAAASGGDARLAALNGAKAALAAYGTKKAVQAAEQGAAPALVKATVSVGGGTSHASEQDSSVTNAGSTLAAGHNLAVIATGSGATDGDIVARGTQISAQNVTLDATRDIDLESAKDTTQLASHNSSGNFGVGAGVSLGGSQNGFTGELAASGAKGFANGTSTTNRDTQVSASDTLTMTSGRDTTLAGAQVSGNTVAVDVGRNLTIASQQDTARYDGKQESAGLNLSVCVPPLCVGQTMAGSASVSGQSITNSYQSVNQQSGIYAGDGGFDVNVGNHTQLDGGVISGTATPDRNALSTQTLGYTNLENHAEYSGTSVGFSGSTNGQPGNASLAIASMGPTGFGAAGTGDSASGTTLAAVSPGTITVRGDAGTDQDSTAGLSRDPASANGSVTNQFNAQQVKNDLAVQQTGAQVGMQVAGDVADRLAKSDPSLWGADGAGRMGLHAGVAGAVAALGGGNVAGAVAGTVAGDLASSAAGGANNLAGNIVAGAAGAAAGAAAGGATGAVSGANGALAADLYNRQLHPDEYAQAKKNAKVVADQLGISVEAAEGRIVAEILRNSDKQTAEASGGVHDWEVRSIIGCQNLNCDGYKNDPHYADHNYNSQYIVSNQGAYNAGQQQLGTGLTAAGLRDQNIVYERAGKAAIATTACLVSGGTACQAAASGLATTLGLSYLSGTPLTTAETIGGLYGGALGGVYGQALSAWAGGASSLIQSAVLWVTKTGTIAAGKQTGVPLGNMTGLGQSVDPMFDPSVNPWWGMRNTLDRLNGEKK
jgi:filamentous hemagglutinin